MFLKGSMLCLAFSPAKREGWSAGFYPQRRLPFTSKRISIPYKEPDTKGRHPAC